MDTVERITDARLGLFGLTAAAAGMAPLAPPAEWFEMPEPDGPTPLTVTAEGQVFGHAAVWDSCHTAFPGRCTKPPRSPSGYSYFHLGEVITSDGSPVSVGKITMNTGHASIVASPTQAISHYDNTGAVAAYVRASDGEYGIWVCGAARPDAPAEKVAALRAAAVSGDWRRPKPGSPMEMIGLLAVNVPGFPVPRAPLANLVASGPAELVAELTDDDMVLALVAAGVMAPKDEETGEPADEVEEPGEKCKKCGAMVGSADDSCQACGAPSPARTKKAQGTMVAAGKTKVEKVLHEFKTGTLHSGKGGPVVKSRKQAIAIAISEAERAKRKKAKDAMTAAADPVTLAKRSIPARRS